MDYFHQTILHVNMGFVWWMILKIPKQISPFHCRALCRALCRSPTVLVSELLFQKKDFRNTIKVSKQFGSWSGPTFCRSWSGSKLFTKVISRRQKWLLARKELSYTLYIKTFISCFNLMSFDDSTSCQPSALIGVQRKSCQPVARNDVWQHFYMSHCVLKPTVFLCV